MNPYPPNTCVAMRVAVTAASDVYSLAIDATAPLADVVDVILSATLAP